MSKLVIDDSRFFFSNSPGSKQLVQGISTVRRKIPVSRQHHNKESEEEKLKISFDNPCGRVTGELLNAGSSPVFNIDGSKGGAKLSGGPLDCDEYALQQFHFHFGCENGQGSEHLIDNQAFPAQVLITSYSYFMWNSKIIMGSNGIIVILYK